MSAVIEAGFDYSDIDEVKRNDVRKAAERIKVRMERTVQDIIEIGIDLNKVKVSLGHGNFLRWIEAEFGMSESSAIRFMRVAAMYEAKSVTVTDLTAKALYELAAPSTPQEVRDQVEELVLDGEKVTVADIKAMKEQFASERKTLKQQIDDAKFKAKDAKASADEFSSQLNSLRSELSSLRDENHTLKHELENRPVASEPVAEAKPQASLDDLAEQECADLFKKWASMTALGRQKFLDRVSAGKPQTA